MTGAARGGAPPSRPAPRRPAALTPAAARIAAAALLAAALAAILFLNRARLTLAPWRPGEVLDMATYGDAVDDGRGGLRLALITRSERSALILGFSHDGAAALLHEARGAAFTAAKFVSLDPAAGDLYVLDMELNGVGQENVERVLRFTPDARFAGEVYAYRYPNEDFLNTKGKICGMAADAGQVTLIRLERDGVFIERVDGAGGGVTAAGTIPRAGALRDLMYGHVNPAAGIAALTTKAGGIEWYDLTGRRLGERAGRAGSLPNTAAVLDPRRIVFTDLLQSGIVVMDTVTGGETLIQKIPPGASYPRINAASNGAFVAVSVDTALVGRENGGAWAVDAVTGYRYRDRPARIALFAAALVDAALIAGLLIRLVRHLPLGKRSWSETGRLILAVSLSLAICGFVSSTIIINEMNDRYYDRVFSELENISALMAASIDLDTPLAIDSPAQYDSAAYQTWKAGLWNAFGGLRFNGERVYQIITRVRDGMVSVLYELETSVPLLYPAEIYGPETYFAEALAAGDFIRFRGQVTAEGTWAFVCGPLYDRDGNAAAFLETGYDLRGFAEDNRAMIFQIALIVAAAAVALLLVIIECVMLAGACRDFFSRHATPHIPANAAGVPALNPALPRAAVFLLFAAGSVPAAVLPLYAAQIYRPLAALPRELVVALPISADNAAATAALAAAPALVRRFGLRRFTLAAALGLVLGNAGCLAAPDTAALAGAYALIGFCGGSLILSITSVIGGSRDARTVSAGFAHYNAAYLAGVNVAVVAGSVLAQFVSYRSLYLVSTVIALLFLAVVTAAIRSRRLAGIFEITGPGGRAGPAGPGAAGSLVRFLLRPETLGLLLLALLPYTVSTCFTSYLMPLYGVDAGLREANIGQLMLLSGLFAILFGAGLCEAASRRAPARVLAAASILLCAFAIFLFSLHVSAAFLIAAVTLLALGAIFTLTSLQTRYATLYREAGAPPVAALSVYAAVENVSMAVGPVVFSYVYARDVAGGTRLFALALAGCCALFLALPHRKPRSRPRRRVTPAGPAPAAASR